MTKLQNKKVKWGNRVPKNLTRGFQILELKQMADMAESYKTKCKEAIQAYKNWQAKHADETDVIELLYGSLEGPVLRRQAQDAIQLYWVVRQDFRKAFQEYLDKSCAYPSMTYSSKAA